LRAASRLPQYFTSAMFIARDGRRRAFTGTSDGCGARHRNLREKPRTPRAPAAARRARGRAPAR
jgi:hypothetical protein